MRRIAGLIVAGWLCLPISAFGFGYGFEGGCGGYNSACSAAPSYTGPGDVVSGAILWASPARVYDAALANTSTSLADLVAVTGGAAVCTLRGSSTGYADLTSSYCAGTTPAAACAAASGGACSISKLYDQTGHSNHLTQAVLSEQPRIAFSTLNGMPGIACTNAGITIMQSPAVTLAQPFSFSSVFERTANPTNAILILGSNDLQFSPNLIAAEFNINFGANLVTGASITESAFHAAQGVVNGTSSVIAIDSITPTTGNAGANGYSGQTLRFCRNGASLDGFVMEVGLWPVAFNSTQYGNMNTNQHSATVGYNF